MARSLETFLAESESARRVTVQPRIVLAAWKQTPYALAEYLAREQLDLPARAAGQCCQLVINGTVMANGRLEKQDGEYVFIATEGTDE
jgi:hypothetical protein